MVEPLMMLRSAARGSTAWVLAAALLLAGFEPAFGQAPQTTPHPPAIVSLELSDFVIFFKYFLWVCGGFITILTIMSLAFFGFDIRKARSSIQSDLLNFGG
jgi:hypothetical protein